MGEGVDVPIEDVWEPATSGATGAKAAASRGRDARPRARERRYRAGDRTLDLEANFLRWVTPGRVVGKGRVVHRDDDIAFAEGSLFDSAGAELATATSTIRVIESAAA